MIDVVNQELVLNGDEAIGSQIVLKACLAPFKQIVENTGFDSSVVLEETLAQDAHFGFNAISEKVEDLVKSGVIDPAKVVKTALKLAASTAGMVLLSEVLIGDAPDDEK